MNAQEVKSLLTDRIEAVCEHLLPSGKRKGHEWCVGSIGGEAGDSMKVSLNSGKAGVWADFAENRSGDIFELWMACRGLNFVESLKDAKNWLGIDDEPERRFRHPLAEKKAYKRPETSQIGLLESGGDVFAYLSRDRQIDPQVLFRYKVGQKFDIKKGHVCVFPIYESTGRNVELVKFLGVDRPDGKKQIWATPDGKPHLFGWQAIPKDARTVCISEGELDAMTIATWGHACLSVPSGATNMEWVEHDFDALERFEKIYLCTDMDAPGHKCAEEIAQRLGRERCYRIFLPFKDANEALCSGKFLGPDFDDAVAQAKTLDPAQLRNMGELGDAIWEAIHPTNRKQIGTEPPVALNWRCRHGEVSIWTGYSGSGKSHILNQFLLHDAHQGERICIASFEMPAPKIGARLVQMMVGQVPPPEKRELITPAIRVLSDRFWVIDHVGVMHFPKLMPMLAYAAKRYGCSRFVVDSLLRCGIAEDDYNAQKEFVGQLQNFADAYGHVHLVCHSRKSDDETKAPSKMDVRGAGAMTDLCDNGFSVWRNKAKEQKFEEARINGGIPAAELFKAPDTQLSMWKNRETGEEPYVKLWLHKPSGQFVDQMGKKIFDYAKTIQ